MQVVIEESKKLRRASACLRDGRIIHVKLPRHWPRDLKHSVTQELVERLHHKDQKEQALLERYASKQQRVTITTKEELEAFVRQVNRETFQVALGKVQIGWAKYNHLAQVNLRSKTMTVSKYCLQEAPLEALRYLIIHELAHYFESGHGPKFWALVGRHIPDYRLQSRIMKAFHHQAVIQEDGALKQPLESESLSPEALPKTGYASRPRASKSKRELPQPVSRKPGKRELPANNLPENNKTGLKLPGFVKQLLLWEKR